jgi:hypothetical protein
VPSGALAAVLAFALGESGAAGTMVRRIRSLVPPRRGDGRQSLAVSSVS